MILPGIGGTGSVLIWCIYLCVDFCKVHEVFALISELGGMVGWRWDIGLAQALPSALDDTIDV